MCVCVHPCVWLVGRGGWRGVCSLLVCPSVVGLCVGVYVGVSLLDCSRLGVWACRRAPGVCVGLDPRGGGVPIRGDAQLFPVGHKASGSWRYFHTPSLSQVDWGLRQSSQPWGWCVSRAVRTPVYV